MTTEKLKYVFDCATGEGNYLPMTESEIADMEAQQAISAQNEERLRVEQEAAAAARESARAKLAALGLTEAEVAALVK